MEGLSVDEDAAVAVAVGEDVAEDAGGVGVAASDEGFAADVVHGFAYHGVEAEVADVDGVAVVDAHDVDGVGGAVDEAVEVLEVVLAAVVLDVVVAGAGGVDGDL